MSAEPTLPPPLSPTGASSRELRKRAREYIPSSSSDPPLFSSDEAAPTADDDGIGGRQSKRRYRGTWWGLACAPRGPKCRRKRQFTRTMDSGVWLGSDGSDMSAEDNFQEHAREVVDRADARQGSCGLLLATGSEALEPRVEAPNAGVETPATLADRTIRTCLEEGNELVDLSNLRLATLSTSTIRPLRYMTKHPKIDHLPPSQESYTPLVPSIRLFLSGNLLHSVPGEIFNIHNLTVLSLRNNQLTELPSGIARLTNLVELNVGGNKLSWLPYELLGLVRPHGRLRTLSIYPNPLLEVDGILPEMRPIVVERGRPVSTSSVEQSHDRDLEAWPQHVGSTPITYFNVDGSLYRGSTESARTQRASCPRPPVTPGPSTPSLVELSLRACSASPYLAHLPGLLPPDGAESMTRLLGRAQTAVAQGGCICTQCGRAFVLARTEWIEWWDQVPQIGSHQSSSWKGSVMNVVPLIRRGCSWSCAPASVSAT